MDEIERHYKLNIYLLSSIGLWPYASKRIRRTQNILVSSVLWSVVVLLLGVLGTIRHTAQLLLEHVSYILATLCFLFKYNCFLFQIGTVKRLMTQVKYDWDSLMTEGELGIIKQHARMGTFYTKLFALLVCPTAFVILLSPFLYDLLNVGTPSNKSRHHQFLVKTGTILDEEKYFYVLLSIGGSVLFTGVTTVLATEGIFFAWLHHAAGMFEIASYRFKHVVVPDSMKTKLSSKFDVWAFANIMDAHRRAIKFFNYLKGTLSPTYLPLIGFAVVVLSINLYRLARVFDSFGEIDEYFFSGSIVFSQLMYIYYFNYSITQPIDFSNDIFKDSYNIRWYEAPVTTQKMLLFIMLGNVQPIRFDFYGFYDPSIGSFATIIRVSFSYFMVLRSIQ